MLSHLAIYTANHGLGWNWSQPDISLMELEECRMAFGDLPDFDSGDVGFEGVAVLGEKVFVVRCFRAMRWDFRGRDAVYLAMTWFPRVVARDVDLETLLALPPFHEPMRNPPLQFECPTIPGTSGVSLWNLVGNLTDGVALRREIGKVSFERVMIPPTSIEPDSQPAALLPPSNVSPQPSVKRNRRTILMWMLISVLVGVLALLCLLLKDVLNGKDSFPDDGSGTTVEERRIPKSNKGTNDVSGRTVSEERVTR